MNKAWSNKNKLLKRVGIFISLFMLVSVQAYSVYAASCMVGMKANKMSQSNLQQNASSPADVISAQKSENQVANRNDLPHCHQQMEMVQKQPQKQFEPSLENVDSVNDCCGDNCSCIKGGCGTISFIPFQLQVHIFNSPSQVVPPDQDNMASILIKNLFRPPISALLG